MIFKLKVFGFLAMLFLTASLSIFTIESFAGEKVLLTAEPSEVAAGSGFGKNRIRWKAFGEADEARSFFVKEDGTLSQIGKGRTGEIRENFIFPNRNCEYRLYPANSLDAPLTGVTVVGTQSVNYAPDFQTLYKKFLKPWAIPLGLIFLLLFTSHRLRRREKYMKLQKHLLTAAMIFAFLGADRNERSLDRESGFADLGFAQ